MIKRTSKSHQLTRNRFYRSIICADPHLTNKIARRLYVVSHTKMSNDTKADYTERYIRRIHIHVYIHTFLEIRKWKFFIMHRVFFYVIRKREGDENQIWIKTSRVKVRHHKRTSATQRYPARKMLSFNDRLKGITRYNFDYQTNPRISILTMRMCAFVAAAIPGERNARTTMARGLAYTRDSKIPSKKMGVHSPHA